MCRVFIPSNGELEWLYFAGAVGAIISCLGLSFAQHQHIWQHFLSQGLLFGLTMSFGTTVALAVASQHFERNRALVMGIIATGSSAGGVCFPIMFARLVPAIGFRWTVRVMPIFFLVCYGTAIVISRPKMAPRSMKSLREIVDFEGFRDVRYAVLAVATVIGNLGLYVPYNYMGRHLQSAWDPSTLLTQGLLHRALFWSAFPGGCHRKLLADPGQRRQLLRPCPVRIDPASGIVGV